MAASLDAEDVNADGFDAYCRDLDDLADSKRPRSWTFVDEVEGMATGKNQRYRYRG